MHARQLLVTAAVAAAAALVPTAAPAAVPDRAPDRAAAAPGTQVGSEGVRTAPRADGIIAILIG